MYKQEDAFFNEEINKYGCYFFCILRMCELSAGSELSKSQVDTIYNYGKAMKYIGPKCSVEKPDLISRKTLDLLGCKKGIYQVGELQTGKPVFWGWASKAPYNNPEYVALKYKTNGEIGHHFVLADQNQEIIFDPSIHDYTDRPILGGLLHKVIGG
jgi:hypothetical protein